MFAGMTDGTYDMGIASHTPSALPLWFVESRFTEDNNIFHVQDLAPYTERMEAVKAETDPAARTEAVAALEELMAQERPFIPLWFRHRPPRPVPHSERDRLQTSASFSNENVWEWSKQ